MDRYFVYVVSTASKECWHKRKDFTVTPEFCFGLSYGYTEADTNQKHIFVGNIETVTAETKEEAVSYYESLHKAQVVQEDLFHIVELVEI